MLNGGRDRREKVRERGRKTGDGTRDMERGLCKKDRGSRKHSKWRSGDHRGVWERVVERQTYTHRAEKCRARISEKQRAEADGHMEAVPGKDLTE